MKNNDFLKGILFIFLLFVQLSAWAENTMSATKPIVDGSFYCIGELTTFSPPIKAECTCATGTPTITWWDSSGGGNMVATGNEFHPILDGLVPNDVADCYYYYAQCECPDGTVSQRNLAGFNVANCNLSACSTANCTYYLVLEDGSGDGWDGASIDVGINGGTTVNYKMTVANCIKIIPLELNENDLLSLSYIIGANEFEHGFSLYDSKGQIAVADTGTPIHFQASPPPLTYELRASCSTCCEPSSAYTVRITMGQFPAEQSWELFSDTSPTSSGTSIFSINGANYTNSAPGTVFNYNISLEQCQSYAFFAYDATNPGWNGGTWELISPNLDYGTEITASNDPLVGNALILDGPNAGFTTSDSIGFVIPCQNGYVAEAEIIDTGSTNCSFVGDVILNEPFVCAIHSFHASCVSEEVYILIEGSSTNINTISGPFTYTDGFGSININALPFGCHTLIHETTYCDGVLSKCTTELNIVCPTTANNSMIEGYKLACTHPEALNENYTHTEIYMDNALLPFTMMNNGIGLQNNAFVPIAITANVMNELLQEIVVQVDLSHNDYSDLEIILHAPASVGITPITLATFGEVMSSNSFTASTSNTSAFSNLLGNAVNTITSTNSDNTIVETLGSLLPSNIGNTWYLQILDNRSIAPNAAYGGGIINTASIAITSGFPSPALNFGCTAQSINLLSETLYETNCDHSEGTGAYIERVWEITDQNNQTSTAIQQIDLVFPLLSEIILPRDTTVDCSLPVLDDPSIMGTPQYQGFDLTASSSTLCDITFSYNDIFLNTCGDGYKIIRTWSVLNWCTGQSIEHELVINREDTTLPSLSPLSLTVNANLNTCTGTIGLSNFSITDECSGISSATASYPIAGGLYYPNGNNTLVGLFSGASIDLPLGDTEVLMTVKDGCLNQATYLVLVTVVDNSPPTAICINPISTILNANGIGQLSVSDINNGSTDDCSATTLLELRRIDTGTSPCGSISPWGQTVDFNSCDAGYNVVVQLQITDAAGNSSICETNVDINYADCENTLILNGNPIANQLFQADQTITSNGTVGPSGNVEFAAGTEINLEAEFEVILGSTFHAFIQNCSTTLQQDNTQN